MLSDEIATHSSKYAAAQLAKQTSHLSALTLLALEASALGGAAGKKVPVEPSLSLLDLRSCRYSARAEASSVLVAERLRGAMRHFDRRVLYVALNFATEHKISSSSGAKGAEKNSSLRHFLNKKYRISSTSKRQEFRQRFLVYLVHIFVTERKISSLEVKKWISSLADKFRQ